jgi:hypothetical protein
MLVGRRGILELTVGVEGVEITTAEATRYLSVVFDRNLRMTEHVRRVTKKGQGIANKLARIMPNQGGPGDSRRRMIASVVYSILLYGAPIWRKATGNRTCVKLLESVHRQLTLRICSAYRTTATEALSVIAGIPPIELQVETRAVMEEQNEEEQESSKEDMMVEWQKRWEQGTKGRWTRTLITDVKIWKKRQHGEVDFYITQALTGHGCYGEYLKRIGKERDDTCWYCDTAAHTLFECSRWESERLTMEGKTETRLTSENFVDIMVHSKQRWDVVAEFVRKIRQKREGRKDQRVRG